MEMCARFVELLRGEGRYEDFADMCTKRIHL
jgi:hypothetical protein